MNRDDFPHPVPVDEQPVPVDEQPVPSDEQPVPSADAAHPPLDDPDPDRSAHRWLIETLRSLAIVVFVLVTSALGFLIASGAMLVIAIWVVTGSFHVAALRDSETMTQVVQSRIGFPLLVVTPQLVLIIPAIVMAFVSRTPTRQALGLVRGHWPLWAWGASAIAVPLVGIVSGVTCSLFLEESDQLKQMAEIFREHGQSGFLLPLALMIGITPAVCEEILFRGYVQTRLARTIGPLVGILLASSVFALFHWDPVHAVAVFPIGLFLGWVSWRSGSLFPAMLGHFVNNVTSVAAVVLTPEADAGALALPSALFMLMVLGAGVLGMGAMLVASVLYGRPAPATVQP